MKKFLTILAAASLFASYANAISTTSNPISITDNEETGLSTVIFQADVHCEGCKKKIEKNLAYEKGVKEIKVDIKSKTITVTFKKNRNNPEKLSAALVKLGYDNKIMIIK
ncbi:MAG: heavy-metal-associated domain-containing protein [Bacteroidia bacterium]|nr:heavy-metal-associated domain-containing protein [Bacteroidia bacterium]